MPENFYDLLGVDEDATSDELKRAYRERAREYHPDVNADDRAGTQFKTVRRAYDVLRDETERSAYDRLGHETYVRKRMKGLPTSSPSNSSSSASSSSSQSTASTSTSQSSTSSGGSTSSSGATASRSSSSRTATNNSKTRQQDRNRRQSSTASAASESKTRSSDSAQRSTRRTTSTNRAPNSATNGNASTQSSRTTARQYEPQQRTRSSGRRTQLRNRWVAVFLAVGVYVAGFAQFVLADQAALGSLLARLAADPVSALATGWGLGAPTTFVGTLVATPSPALLFPVGAVLLPAALAVTVFTFGRGAAWLYLLGALGPLVGLVAGPLLPTATAVDLALFVVLPVVAALVFLGDVGRYLVATR